MDPADVSVRNLDYTTKGGFYVSQISGDTDENLNTAFFTVSLSSAPSSDNVTITMATSDSGEGVISNVTGGTGNDDNSTLVFTSSDWNSVRTVTVKGVADNLSDGDQDYAIVLTGDSSSTDLRFRNVDPADVSVRNLDYTTKGGFYVSQISGDTDENLNTAFFTVSLSSAPSSDNVTITMATSDSGEGVISNVTGGTGNDDNSTLVFTSSDWNSVRTVTVKGVADNLSDGDQDYAIVLTGDSSSTDLRFRNVDPADVSVRNLDYTTKGGFYVSQISGDTDENLNTAFFTVSLSSAPSSDNVTITMATSDSGEGVISNVTGGTGNDDNSTLVFTSSDWNSVRTVTVKGVADNLSDGDQDYAIVLTGDSSSTDLRFRNVDPADVSVRNLDYTTKGGFYVSQISGDTDENLNTAFFTVSLSSAPSSDNVTITMATSDSGEGVISNVTGGTGNDDNSTLVFTSSDWNSVRTVTVKGVADNLSDGDQDYAIVLTGDSSSTDLRFRNVDPADVSVRNLDYTTKGGFYVSQISGDTDENLNTAFFTVSLSSAPSSDNVTITMATSDSGEGVISNVTGGTGNDDNSTLVFTSSDWNSVRTVTVKGVADNLSDGDQDYAIVLTGDSSSTDLRFRNVDPADVSVRNLDYTTKGGFYVSQISGDTDENLNTAFFTVSLSSAPSSDNVTITMATSDSGEGVISNVTGGTGNDDNSTLVFTSSDWNSVRTVTVKGVADNLSDGDQDYAIVLTGDSSSTDLRFRNVDPADVSVRNLDYTTKGGFYVSQISGDTDENLNTAFFTVSLSSAPSSDNVTITMATSDSGEGVISNVTGGTGNDDNSTLVFTSSDWNSVRTVTVKGVADNLSDGDQDYAIVLTGDSSSTDLRFRNVDPADVSVRNLDYTTKGGFYVSQISGDTDENLNTAFFTVSLSSAPSSDNVTITMATSDSGEGVISNVTGGTGNDDNSTLVFTSSDWNSVRTVTVKGVADNLSDGDQDYAIVLTGDSSSTDLRFRNVDPADVSVRNLDYTTKGGFYVSQISGDTDENLNTAFFTVSLSSAPSSDNVTITMATSDSGEGVISNVTGGTGNDDNSTLVFTSSDWNSVRTVTVKGVADNLSDGDQDYAIVLTGDSSSTDLRFRNVDPADVSVRNLDYTTKGGFYVSQISGDTDENLNTAFFTVSLSSAPSSDNVTITMATSDSGEGVISNVTGGTGNDDNSTLVFTSSDWNSVRTVTVKGVADNLSDGDQDYAIVLTGDSSSTDLRFRNVDPADVSVRNLDYTTKGGFYVSQISGDTDENLNTAFFTVSLSSAPSSDNVTITMATSDSGEGVISNVTGGTGNDDNSTLVFTSSDWNSVRTVTVKGVADNLSDGDQDYAIVLTGDSSSTDLRFRNVDPADVSVRNLDYTTKGGFYVSQISGDTDENLNTAFFTVSLSSAPSSDNVTITMATSDSGEGVISNVTGGTGNDDNSTLVFTSSDWNSVRTVTVKGVADNLSDGDQDYAIVLTGDSSSTDLRFRNVDPADVSVRNLDYTTKGGFYVSQISGDTDENLNTAFFTVSLSSAPSSDNVTITMATSDSGEGVISNVTGGTGNDDNSTLVFTSSDWNSVRTVTVKGVADNLSDGDQDYAIVLTGDSSSTDLRFRNVDPADVSVRNLDYTTKGGFYVSQISGDTDENLNTAFFTVSLSSAPSSDNVTITMATSDSGEGVISNVTGGTGNDDNSTLVFTSSDWNSVRTVTVKGVADNLSDGDQDYAIVLTGDSSSTDLRFRNVDPADVSVRNLDYTTKGGFYVSQISGDTDENLNTAFFTVSLSSAPSSDNVTITMATSDSGEGVISNVTGGTGNDDNSTLVFTSSDWNSVRTVTVKGVADNLSDGDQDYAIVLTGDSSSTDLRFRNVDPADVSVRNLDYTTKGGFYVSQISGDTDENLNTAFFTVSLSSAPSSDNVTITMATSDSGEGVISNVTGGTGNDDNSTLVFTSSDWNSVRTVTVKGVADNLSDGDQDYAIVLTGDSSSTDLRFRNVDPADVSVRNLDYTTKGGFYVSQISGDTDENLNTAFFTVSLSSAPSSDNVTITMATSDSGEGVISNVTGGTGNDDNSTLVFTSSDWNSVRTVTVKGVADNLSDGDQDYAIVLTGDSSSTDLRFRNVDPADVSVRNLDYTTKGGFYVSQISGDTDENLNTAFFTVSLSSAPSSDNVTITMATSDSGEGVISNVTGGTGT